MDELRDFKNVGEVAAWVPWKGPSLTAVLDYFDIDVLDPRVSWRGSTLRSSQRPRKR